MSRDVFVGVSDPTRRSIVHMLTVKSMRLNDLAENFEISRPAISKHVKVLEECGVIAIESRGRERICQIKPQALKELADWINQYKAFWNQSLDQLEFLLSEESKNQTNE
ncbi:ArsR/SmtB family transcription factor [Marinoscillum pacificum]|uniref:ArsR/SmtB family transcription factor n=1 Tax=Marinoscillum pacificum TaxID=392723 RepID=UPI00215847CC|nr:metalloregulator ArsR/SmtB family transcription factor [Marinoscillum pacificum]